MFELVEKFELSRLFKLFKAFEVCEVFGVDKPFVLFKAFGLFELFEDMVFTNKIGSKATSPSTLSFRLVRNLSLFSEGFPTRFACGNDNTLGYTYDLLSNLFKLFSITRPTRKGVGFFLPCLSFRLVRNPSDNVFRQVLHERIFLPDKLYFILSAHILQLFFPDYGASAVLTELIINKLMQVVSGCKTVRIKIVLMLIDPSCQIICYPHIEGRSRIGHNIHGKKSFFHTALISERFRTSRNDIHATLRP
jgi:hypothetical protein